MEGKGLTTAGHCPYCGAELPEVSSTEGMCPECMMKLALEDWPSTDGDRQATATVSPASEGRPECIGPYRLLSKLGEGGMGEVWLAEQQKPVRRKVALKLIKWGMDSKQVIARFESERQALALMDHTNIAKVFDAGATDQGRPYFVMEYVEGVPITAHCDRHRLATRQRLELLMQVCEGVQHAHQKGVIHRDIKPSNVLVRIQGDKAVPKIIDFGVAKATSQRLTEKTLFTEQGVLVGTPEYMSPEQADLTAQDIDTRTDVYSVGVLLYQLLAGALPFESKELRQAGFEEIRRKIREDDPPKPSTRLSTLEDQTSKAAAKSRRTDLSSLKRQLRGDLDWITMKALEKDRTRRYGSPNELAADIGRQGGRACRRNNQQQAGKEYSGAFYHQCASINFSGYR
jgi:serine/threonine protein kinase